MMETWKGKNTDNAVLLWEHKTKTKHYFIYASQNRHNSNLLLCCYEKFGNSNFPIFHSGKLYWDYLTLPQYVRNQALKLYEKEVQNG